MSTYGRQQGSGCRQTCMCCANNCTHRKRYHPLAPLQYSLAPCSGGQHTSAGWLRCVQQTSVPLSKLQERNGTRDACLTSSSLKVGQCLHPCPRVKQSTVLNFTSDRLLKAPRQDLQSVQCYSEPRLVFPQWNKIACVSNRLKYSC